MDDRVTLACGLALCLTVASGAGLSAQHWPQFRGPTGQGTSTETALPLSWSASENVHWQTELPGPGHSSPVVWGDRIYLTAFRSERRLPLARFFTAPRGQLVVLALDKTTGAILWERVVVEGELQDVHSTNSPASPTPVTDGQHVYVFFGSVGLLCLDVDGNEVWRRDFGEISNQWGSASSPVLHEGVVLLNSDSDGEDFLIAVDQATGETRWRTPRGRVTRSWPTPFLWQVDGRDQVVVSGSRQVKGYDFATGEEIWSVGGLTEWVAPTPVTAHGLLYVASNGPGGNVVLAIRPGGRGDVTGTHVAWRYGRGAPYVSSPVVVGDYLYMVKNGGIMTALDARTGELARQGRLPVRGNYYASLVAADGRIYTLNDEGEATVLEASPAFEVLAVNEVGERTLASPAISDGQIFIRSDDSLFAIGQPR